MSLHSKIFKIEKVEDPFDIKDGEYNPEDVLIRIDWRDEGNYSEQLNKQVKYNLLLQIQLENNCRASVPNKDPISFYIISNYGKNIGYIYEEKKFPTLREQCREYISSVRNDHDVLSRDHDIFTTINKKSNQINVTFYALVVYDDEGFYVGHVYLWFSPHDPTFIFMIGIRVSPIMPFLRLQGYGFKNISGYILKKVEEFAKNNNANKIIIPNPIGKMEGIAVSNGFEKFKHVNRKIAGRTGDVAEGMINFWDDTCVNCYLKNL